MWQQQGKMCQALLNVEATSARNIWGPPCCSALSKPIVPLWCNTWRCVKFKKRQHTRVKRPQQFISTWGHRQPTSGAWATFYMWLEILTHRECQQVPYSTSWKPDFNKTLGCCCCFSWCVHAKLHMRISEHVWGPSSQCQVASYWGHPPIFWDRVSICPETWPLG